MAKRVKFELSAGIEEALKLDQRIKREETRLAELKDLIKAEFVDRAITQFHTVDGVASLTLATSKSYDVDKLRDVLTDQEFGQLCPATPNGKNIDAAVQLKPELGTALRAAGAFTEKTTQRFTFKPK